MNPRVYQALAIKHALTVYANTGIKVNRAYTPSAMLAAASQITGQTYGRRAYSDAIASLNAWIAAQGDK